MHAEVIGWTPIDHCAPALMIKICLRGDLVDCNVADDRRLAMVRIISAVLVVFCLCDRKEFVL